MSIEEQIEDLKVKIIAAVGRGDLYADPCLIPGYNRIAEGHDVDAFLKKHCRHLRRLSSVTEHYRTNSTRFFTICPWPL